MQFVDESKAHEVTLPPWSTSGSVNDQDMPSVRMDHTRITFDLTSTIRVASSSTPNSSPMICISLASGGSETSAMDPHRAMEPVALLSLLSLRLSDQRVMSV